jgi:hypothetical protein
MEVSRLRFELQRADKTSLDWNRLVGFTTQFAQQLPTEYNLKVDRTGKLSDSKLVSKVQILQDRVIERKEQLALLDLDEVERRIIAIKKGKR